MKFTIQNRETACFSANLPHALNKESKQLAEVLPVLNPYFADLFCSRKILGEEWHA